jgi:hypothetical protein
MAKTKKSESKPKSNIGNLNAIRVGLALGKVAGIYMVLLALFSKLFGWGGLLLRLIGSIYVGYDTSLKGVIIGAVWAFIDMFIAGWLFAQIYNHLGKYKFIK